MGISHTLDCIASFGTVAHFIGMTTDSRSILSFVRHDYFRRILCSWLDNKNREDELGLTPRLEGEIIRKICYENAKQKIVGV
jgi:glucuronate isomerase